MPAVDYSLTVAASSARHQLPTVADTRERVLCSLAVHAVTVIRDEDVFDPAQVVVLAGHCDVVRVFVEGIPDEFGQPGGRLLDIALQDGLACMNLDRGHGYIVSRATDSDAAFGFNLSRAVPPPPWRRDDLTADLVSSALVRLRDHRCVFLE